MSSLACPRWREKALHLCGAFQQCQSALTITRNAIALFSANLNSNDLQRRYLSISEVILRQLHVFEENSVSHDR